MKILIEVEIPESGFAFFRRAAPPPPDWSDEQVSHATIRALIMGITHDIGARGFDFDTEVRGNMYGGGYCVRRLAS
jgi:hypothetical protein